MKKGTRCIARTINLSDPRAHCKSPLQRLISERESRDRTNEYCPLKGVKVCKRQDLQRKCPPKICRPCPQQPVLSTSERLGKIVMFVMKGTIGVGLVYWTCAEGFWGDTAETQDLSNRMINTMMHAVNGRPPKVKDIPPLDQVKHSALQTYNRTVVRCMDVIVGVPLQMHRKLQTVLYSNSSDETTSATRFD